MARVFRSALALSLLLTAFVWASSASAAASAVGAVYALTNATSGNAVLVWNRYADGSLTPAGSYPTGGRGSGGGLGSQGAVILSQDNQLLFTVDAGSDEIASFKVGPGGLTLVGHVASGGTLPTSLTTYKNLLYVLNAGGSGNISGFSIGNDGALSPIGDSTRPLSGSTTAPGQVGFSPDGGLLVVVERATQTIDTFVVGADGRASGPILQHSSGATPFGFAFGHRGQLFVSEAAGAPGGSATSSYTTAADGSLGLVSGSVPTNQRAACWLVVTNDGRYTYTANAGSGSISGYRIDQDGSLTLLDADGRTAAPGANPTDMALSHNSQFLYVRMGSTATIASFAVQADGSLLPIGGAASLPPTAVGLIAR
jgi:6-phosphogluconolactonase (cycloisomerase 2 family)